MSDLSAKLRVLAEAHGCYRLEQVPVDFDNVIPGRFEACDGCVERAHCPGCQWSDLRGYGDPGPVMVPGMPCPRHGKRQT